MAIKLSATQKWKPFLIAMHFLYLVCTQFTYKKETRIKKISSRTNSWFWISSVAQTVARQSMQWPQNCAYSSQMLKKVGSTVCTLPEIHRFNDLAALTNLSFRFVFSPDSRHRYSVVKLNLVSRTWFVTFSTNFIVAVVALISHCFSYVLALNNCAGCKLLTFAFWLWNSGLSESGKNTTNQAIL